MSKLVFAKNDTEEISSIIYDLAHGDTVEGGPSMYSVHRPSMAFWRGFVDALSSAGYNKDQILTILGSTYIRHFFDGIEEQVSSVGVTAGESFVADYRTAIGKMLQE